MAYLDYVGLAYFKSLLDENYLRTDYEGDTVINGNVTFTEPVNASVKNDWLGQQIDKTYIKDVTLDPEGSGALALILGDGTVSHLITDTTVTQVRSNANELYPILLCYDASAEEDQIAKKVWYGNGVRINPRYGYFYSQKMFTLHPSYNRASAPTSRVEWSSDFRDSVLNPIGQVFEYIDPVSSGGEHRMEFRLYGNPNVAGIDTPNVNDETNTISMGVSATRGDALTFFGYCPSTPIYLENGSTMRKSLTRGDQYGRDIITRDWLNLNGSITGLVHTYMDETIDGYKTFLKTVTIDSGNDNAKAGLNVQGDVNIDSGDNTKPSNLYVQGNSHIHGNEDIDGNLNVDGTSTLDGNVHMKHNLDVDGNLNIDGTSDQHGNVHMYSNLDVDGNANTDGNQTIGGTLTVTGNETVGGTLTVAGKITGNGGAEISGGSGLKVNGNETITGNLTVSGTTTTEDLTVNDDATIGDDLTVNGDGLVKGNETVNGNANIGGVINKVSNNTTQEYVTYVTNQPVIREVISQNLISIGSGLAKDADGKIYVDFSQMPTDKFNALLKSLKMLIPLTADLSLHVNNQHANKGDSLIDNRGTENLPFKTIQACIDYFSQKYSLGSNNVYIYVHPGTYNEPLILRTYSTNGGICWLTSSDQNNKPIINRTSNSGTMDTIQVGDSRWNLRWLKIVNNVYDDGTNPTADQIFSSLVHAESNGQAIIRGCECEFNCTDVGNNDRLFMMMFAGNIAFEPDSSATTLKYHKGNAGFMSVLHADGTYISKMGTSLTGGYIMNIACQGDCSIFARALHSGYISNRGGGSRYMKFVVASGKTCTGVKHDVIIGSGIESNNGVDYPGDIEGTVESSTYSWYR